MAKRKAVADAAQLAQKISGHEMKVMGARLMERGDASGQGAPSMQSHPSYRLLGRGDDGSSDVADSIL